ncbi:Uncharacterised protein [Rothia kristinae]|nr:Uncharacterised protein [Rothia kristinae]
MAASAYPASSPGPRPTARATEAYTSATEATPMSTSGTIRDQVDSPNSFTDSAIGHREAGGLSTVMELPMSEEPNRKASQLSAPAWAAAA